MRRPQYTPQPMRDAPANIFRDTEPLVAADGRTAHSEITDDWGLFFAQGGVVMATALRAMTAVLQRSDLKLVSASGTFCRPVTCGPVTTEVQVLRNGRRGAQVTGLLRDQTAPEGETSVSVTAVYADLQMPGVALTPLEPPVSLREVPPPHSTTAASAEDTEFPLGFLDNTEWHVPVIGDPEVDASPEPRMTVWFRFTDPPAPAGTPWDPALLPIPGDALGSALAGAFGEDQPTTAVSLFIAMLVLAPIEGTWIGIDTSCTHVGNGVANGVLDLWSEAGVHVATVTQTAMIRDIGGI